MIKEFCGKLHESRWTRTNRVEEIPCNTTRFPISGLSTMYAQQFRFCWIRLSCIKTIRQYDVELVISYSDNKCVFHFRVYIHVFVFQDMIYECLVWNGQFFLPKYSLVTKMFSSHFCHSSTEIMIYLFSYCDNAMPCNIEPFVDDATVYCTGLVIYIEAPGSLLINMD